MGEFDETSERLAGCERDVWVDEAVGEQVQAVLVVELGLGEVELVVELA